MKEDNLSVDSITRDLGTRFVGQRLIYYPILTSTNDVAKQDARNGAAEGTVIIADEQTAGRGRLKRTWLSPKGSIALSIILYPSLVHLPSLIMLASLGVVHSIKTITGLNAQIKWPNDVLINGRKVCGILIENEVRGDTVAYAVIGIGINVNLCLTDFPDIQAIATSLSDELGKGVSRLSVVRGLLTDIERLYLTISNGESVYEEWRDRLVTLNKRVRAKVGETIYEGVAESVARDGSLLLRGLDNSLIKIVAGDVTLRE
ncbi:MAG: biotin--[acetyl-CoA-carboxylase] ligase [Dehalococcoidales bacterium]|nr:biotin--[acetyl-CoA-carboxylase] ligase [Dehalococcoidales bacterium]